GVGVGQVDAGGDRTVIRTERFEHEVDRPLAVVRDALLDFAALLLEMDVERPVVPAGEAGELGDLRRGRRAQAVRRQPKRLARRVETARDGFAVGEEALDRDAVEAPLAAFERPSGPAGAV